MSTHSLWIEGFRMLLFSPSESPLCSQSLVHLPAFGGDVLQAVKRRSLLFGSTGLQW